MEWDVGWEFNYGGQGCEVLIESGHGIEDLVQFVHQSSNCLCKVENPIVVHDREKRVS
jgi:hypothetical protein